MILVLANDTDFLIRKTEKRMAQDWQDKPHEYEEQQSKRSGNYTGGICCRRWINSEFRLLSGSDRRSGLTQREVSLYSKGDEPHSLEHIWCRGSMWKTCRKDSPTADIFICWVHGGILCVGIDEILTKRYGTFSGTWIQQHISTASHYKCSMIYEEAGWCVVEDGWWETMSNAWQFPRRDE